MRMKLLCIALMLLLVLATGINSSGKVSFVGSNSSSEKTNFNGLTVSPQFDVVQDDRRTTQTAASMPLMQNEPSIAINPKKPSNIIVGYNDFSTLPQTNLPRPFWSYTTDGGTTWIAGAGNLPRFPAAPDLCCDTALAFDKNGTAYLATMTFNIDGGLIVLYVSTPDGSGNAGAMWKG